MDKTKAAHDEQTFLELKVYLARYIVELALRLEPTKEIFPSTGKIIFLRHKYIFRKLEKTLEKREKFNSVRKDLVN